MKYKLFCGACYYAEGGYNDFRGSFDSIEDAKLHADGLPDYCEWAQIVLDDKIIQTGGCWDKSPWKWESLELKREES